MMKRSLIALLFAFPLVAGPHDWAFNPPRIPIIADPQTNTFCAANLACSVTAAWTFSNFTATGTATFTNLTSSGTGAFTNAGTFTNTQMNEPLTFNTNNLSFLANWAGSPNFVTDGLASGILIPSTSTVFQANAINGQLENNSISTNAVGVFVVSRAGANTVKVWGLNPATSDQDHTGTTHINTIQSTIEADSNVFSSTTTGEGVLLTGIFRANSANFPAMQIGPTSFDGTNTYSKGIVIQDAASNSVASPAFTGLQIGAQTQAANTVPSQFIYFISRGSGGGTQLSSVNEDSLGNLNLSSSVGTGGSVVVTGVALSPNVTGIDIGKAALPFQNIWTGTSATNNFKIIPSATSGPRTITITDFGAANAVTNANFPATVVLHAAYTNSTTSFTSINDGVRAFAFPVAANSDYTWSCHLYYQAAATGGLNIEFTGPASPTAVIYGLNDPSAATTFNSAVATSFGTSLGQVVGTAATNFDAVVSLGLANGANAGTITMLAKSSAAVTLTIQPGSYCQVQ